MTLDKYANSTISTLASNGTVSSIASVTSNNSTVTAVTVASNGIDEIDLSNLTFKKFNELLVVMLQNEGAQSTTSNASRIRESKSTTNSLQNSTSSADTQYSTLHTYRSTLNTEYSTQSTSSQSTRMKGLTPGIEFNKIARNIQVANPSECREAIGEMCLFFLKDMDESALCSAIGTICSKLCEVLKDNNTDNAIKENLATIQEQNKAHDENGIAENAMPMEALRLQIINVMSGIIGGNFNDAVKKAFFEKLSSFCIHILQGTISSLSNKLEICDSYRASILDVLRQASPGNYWHAALIQTDSISKSHTQQAQKKAAKTIAACIEHLNHASQYSLQEHTETVNQLSALLNQSELQCNADDTENITTIYNNFAITAIVMLENQAGLKLGDEDLNVLKEILLQKDLNINTVTLKVAHMRTICNYLAPNVNNIIDAMREYDSINTQAIQVSKITKGILEESAKDIKSTNEITVKIKNFTKKISALPKQLTSNLSPQNENYLQNLRNQCEAIPKNIKLYKAITDQMELLINNCANALNASENLAKKLQDLNSINKDNIEMRTALQNMFKDIGVDNKIVAILQKFCSHSTSGTITRTIQTDITKCIVTFIAIIQRNKSLTFLDVKSLLFQSFSNSEKKQYISKCLRGLQNYAKSHQALTQNHSNTAVYIDRSSEKTFLSRIEKLCAKNKKNLSDLYSKLQKHRNNKKESSAKLMQTASKHDELETQYCLLQTQCKSHTQYNILVQNIKELTEKNELFCNKFNDAIKNNDEGVLQLGKHASSILYMLLEKNINPSKVGFTLTVKQIIAALKWVVTPRKDNNFNFDEIGSQSTLDDETTNHKKNKRIEELLAAYKKLMEEYRKEKDKIMRKNHGACSAKFKTATDYGSSSVKNLRLMK